MVRDSSELIAHQFSEAEFVTSGDESYLFYENVFQGFSITTCASSGDSELGWVFSGWIISPSLSKFGGS